MLAKPVAHSVGTALRAVRRGLHEFSRKGRKGHKGFLGTAAGLQHKLFAFAAGSFGESKMFTIATIVQKS